MWKSLSFVLPVLIPSWRFFKTIEPSPRIQWAQVQEGVSPDWQVFQPRPPHVSVAAMLRRLIWNPAWNETLFLVSCAERIRERPTSHSIHEIQRRVADALQFPSETVLQFRLVFVTDGVEEVLFLSEPFPSRGAVG